MAIRQEELRFDVVTTPASPAAAVFEFPTELVRGRAQREQAVVYRRRRAAVAAVALTIVAMGALTLRSASGAAVVSRPGAPATVTLQEGDTLWSVAQRYSPPGSDPRAYIQRIKELNGLDRAPLGGTRIKLPR